MFQLLLQQDRVSPRFAPMAIWAALVLGLCSCQTAITSDVTASIGEKAETPVLAEPRADTELHRERLRVNPTDADDALQYARALPAPGQQSEAVAVLQQLSIPNPDNKSLLAGYGRALADN